MPFLVITNNVDPQYQLRILLLQISFNPFTDKRRWICLASCQNKFAILVHFLYVVWDAKLSAGEQLAGWSFFILSKIWKVTQIENLLYFVHRNASKCNSSKRSSSVKGLDNTVRFSLICALKNIYEFFLLDRIFEL